MSTTAEQFNILISATDGVAARERAVKRAQREAVAEEYAPTGELVTLEFADGSRLELQS